MSFSQRTLANSNYKRLYDDAEIPGFQHTLLHAVHNMVLLYAKRVNPKLTQDAVTKAVDAYMQRIQRDAFAHVRELESDVTAVAEYLWTSGEHHAIAIMEKNRVRP